MYKIIELDKDGAIVDVLFASDELDSIVIDKAKAIANTTNKHIVVVAEYTEVDDDGNEYVNNDLSENIWDSKK